MSKSAATSAADAITPMVLNQITSKNNEISSDDASPLTDIFGSLLSGGSDILGTLSGFLK